MKGIIYKTGAFTSEELKVIARLHERWIPSGFLSLLGVGFLTRLYASIAGDSQGILIAAKDSNGKIVGFVSGTISLRSIYHRLVRRHFAFLSFLSLKCIFLPKILKRIRENMKYSAQGVAGGKGASAELLSIVVDGSVRGTGIAQGLFKELKDAFRQKGVDRFKILVGSQLVAAQKFYVKAGAVEVEEIELHQGERSFVYECAV